MGFPYASLHSTYDLYSFRFFFFFFFFLMLFFIVMLLSLELLCRCSSSLWSFPVSSKADHVLPDWQPRTIFQVTKNSFSVVCSIGRQPEKTIFLHVGQSRSSWPAERGKENQRESLAAHTHPRPHAARKYFEQHIRNIRCRERDVPPFVPSDQTFIRKKLTSLILRRPIMRVSGIE